MSEFKVPFQSLFSIHSIDLQAALSDPFLADLEELSDNEADLANEDDMGVGNMEEDDDGEMADIEALNYDDLDSVSKLQKTQRYIDIMQFLEDDPEYQLIVDCNALSVDIENEIVIIHNFIRDNYRLKFPELESLVHHPIDYARVVKKIGNEMDLTLVDLEGFYLQLSLWLFQLQHQTTSGKPLPEENLKKTVDAFGSAVAAKLMGTAGGLTALAKMPACNVQLLGAKKKNLAGFSTATSQFRVGKTGRTLREEILKKIEKWQEPPPAKQPKPLPVPDSEPKKKRGGRRLRKMKERYAITDMRKLANRMQFGVPEESSLGDGLGEGYGMLGQAGNGKLRVSVGQSKLAAKVAKKFKEKQYGSSGATSGLTSSLAFTPVQEKSRKSEDSVPDFSAP
ncbi:U4/U6 small nuclear ribonucleoprotein Prp31-like [Vitis vinifera]|uniref:U4/U6 small nuclear ribonucleoprotein Prp31-like n=1 Tax=Vitis vinifera TaxID=29760 RepID=A0A438JNS5_VITVI|nr:U4/U6 small nuclear ribonucleoprotein Prp31-like [Vitis vinifera]